MPAGPLLLWCAYLSAGGRHVLWWRKHGPCTHPGRHLHCVASDTAQQVSRSDSRVSAKFNVKPHSQDQYRHHDRRRVRCSSAPIDTGPRCQAVPRQLCLRRVTGLLAGRCIVTPGFVDMHVHVTGGGGEAGPASRCPESQLSAFLNAGVTTVVGVCGTDSVSRSQACLSPVNSTLLLILLCFKYNVAALTKWRIRTVQI